MALKPKPRSTSMAPILPDTDVINRGMSLNSLYKDLPDELKSELKPQYDRAKQHLEKIEKGKKL